MKCTNRQWAIRYAMVFLIFVSMGCSKTADEAGTQPSEMIPNEFSEPPASNASDIKPEITKEQQSREMPMPGQANDHSTLAPNATQRSHAP